MQPHPPIKRKKHTHTKMRDSQVLHGSNSTCTCCMVCLADQFIFMMPGKQSVTQGLYSLSSASLHVPPSPPPTPAPTPTFLNSILSPSNQVMYGSMVVGGQIISLRYGYTTVQPRNCLKTIWIVMHIMHFIYTLVDVYKNCKVSESWMLCHALNGPWFWLNKFFWILLSTLIKIQAK